MRRKIRSSRVLIRGTPKNANKMATNRVMKADDVVKSVGEGDNAK